MFTKRHRPRFLDFTLEQLAGSGVHLGHRSIATDPRIFEMLIGDRNKLSILNLTKSILGLKPGLSVLAKIIAKRGKALFPNVDPRIFGSISVRIKNFCLRYFLVNKKIPGLLTNFMTVRRQFPDLQKTKIIPAFTFAFTARDHHILWESNLLNLPSIGIFDSNTNPMGHAFYAVPGNDDSFTALLLYYQLAFFALGDGLNRYLFKWGATKRFKLRKILNNFYKLGLIRPNSISNSVLNNYNNLLNKRITIDSVKLKKKSNVLNTLISLFYTNVLAYLVNQMYYAYNVTRNMYGYYPYLNISFDFFSFGKCVNNTDQRFPIPIRSYLHHKRFFKFVTSYDYNFFDYMPPDKRGTRFKMLGFTKAKAIVTGIIKNRLRHLILKNKVTTKLKLQSIGENTTNYENVHRSLIKKAVEAPDDKKYIDVKAYFFQKQSKTKHNLKQLNPKIKFLSYYLADDNIYKLPLVQKFFTSKQKKENTNLVKSRNSAIILNGFDRKDFYTSLGTNRHYGVSSIGKIAQIIFQKREMHFQKKNGIGADINPISSDSSSGSSRKKRQLQTEENFSGSTAISKDYPKTPTLNKAKVINVNVQKSSSFLKVSSPIPNFDEKSDLTQIQVLWNRFEKKLNTKNKNYGKPLANKTNTNLPSKTNIATPKDYLSDKSFKLNSNKSKKTDKIYFQNQTKDFNTTTNLTPAKPQNQNPKTLKFNNKTKQSSRSKIVITANKSKHKIGVPNKNAKVNILSKKNFKKRYSNSKKFQKFSRLVKYTPPSEIYLTESQRIQRRLRELNSAVIRLKRIRFRQRSRLPLLKPIYGPNRFIRTYLKFLNRTYKKFDSIPYFFRFLKLRSKRLRSKRLRSKRLRSKRLRSKRLRSKRLRSKRLRSKRLPQLLFPRRRKKFIPKVIINGVLNLKARKFFRKLKRRYPNLTFSIVRSFMQQIIKKYSWAKLYIRRKARIYKINHNPLFTHHKSINVRRLLSRLPKFKRFITRRSFYFRRFPINYKNYFYRLANYLRFYIPDTSSVLSRVHLDIKKFTAAEEFKRSFQSSNKRFLSTQLELPFQNQRRLLSYFNFKVRDINALVPNSKRPRKKKIKQSYLFSKLYWAFRLQRLVRLRTFRHKSFIPLFSLLRAPQPIFNTLGYQLLDYSLLLRIIQNRRLNKRKVSRLRLIERLDRINRKFFNSKRLYKDWQREKWKKSFARWRKKHRKYLIRNRHAIVFKALKAKMRVPKIILDSNRMLFKKLLPSKLLKAANNPKLKNVIQPKILRVNKSFTK